MKDEVERHKERIATLRSKQSDQNLKMMLRKETSKLEESTRSVETRGKNKN